MVLIFPSKPDASAPIAVLGSQCLTPRLSAKCLGYWWSWDLSASKAVDKAINKARRAFFAFGAMGAFHGQLNPISGRSIYEACVVPVLLFGCENWVLTDSMLHQLESFQGEIGRRILKQSLTTLGGVIRATYCWEFTRPQFQPGICHLCGAALDVSYFHHYTLSHTPLSDPERIISSLICATFDFF